MEDHWLCIDIGYTYSRYFVWDGKSFVDSEKKITSRPNIDDGGDAELRKHMWMEQLAKDVGAWKEKWPKIGRVGLSFPGVVNREGAIWSTTAIWGVAQSDLTQQVLAEALAMPVTVLNDLSAAVIRYGTADKYASSNYVMVVSVSSGVGAKLYDREANRLILEKRGRNGEIGLAVVDETPDATVTRNGRLVGVLGHYCSGSAFPRQLRAAAQDAAQQGRYETSRFAAILAEAGQDLYNSDRILINEAAVKAILLGDQFCIDVLSGSIKYLANVLHIAILLNAPDSIVIVGGFARSIGKLYTDILSSQLADMLGLIYTPEEVMGMVDLGENDDMDNIWGLVSRMKQGL